MIGTFIILIFKVRKLKHTEIKYLALIHTVKQRYKHSKKISKTSEKSSNNLSELRKIENKISI